MSKVHMMTLYRIKPDKLEEVTAAVTEFVAAVKEHEPAVLFYEVYRGQGDVSYFHIMTFEDAYSEEKHRSTPHMKVFVGKLYPCCEEEPGFVDLELVGSNVR